MQKQRPSANLLLPEIPFGMFVDEEPPAYLRMPQGNSMIGKSTNDMMRLLMSLPLGDWNVAPKRWNYPGGPYYGLQFERKF